jgi:trk system potassium uptake protein TrkH
MPLFHRPDAPRRQGASPLNAPQLVVISFIAFILAGTLLLSLPQAQRIPYGWVDALFMATSAVCVTGLYTVDPSVAFTTTGQWLMVGLIQIGGLGYMTLFSVAMVAVGKRLSLRDRLMLQEVTEQPGLKGLIAFAVSILRLTLIIEGLGTALLCWHLVPQFGAAEGIKQALFHSVMAFNNAGFPTVPNGAMVWQADVFVLMVLSALTILGGLGFNVLKELINRHLLRKKPDQRWTIEIRLVLTMTAGLLAFGTIALWLLEHGNPRTFGPLAPSLQWANAFFMSVQPRTAGFNSVDVGRMLDPTLAVITGLMFVGGAPGGTAGGVKLTSLAVILATILATVRGQAQVRLFRFRRSVGDATVRRAVSQVTLSLWLVGIVTTLITAIEPQRFLAVVFETMSAFGTVGLSTGITPGLQVSSKLLLVLTMLIGRVGVITVLLTVVAERRPSAVRYGDETLLIG